MFTSYWLLNAQIWVLIVSVIFGLPIIVAVLIERYRYHKRKQQQEQQNPENPN